MKLPTFFGAVAVVGLGTAIAIPLWTRADKQAGADQICRDQYAAAVQAGKKPPRDLSEVKQIRVDRNGQSICGLGGLTWDANHSSDLQK